MNWLRYVVLAAAIFSAIAGYRKGMVKTVLSMVFLLLVTGGATRVNPYVTSILEEHTQMESTIEEKCREALEEQMSVSGNTMQAQEMWLQEAGIPEEIAHQIVNNALMQEYENNQAETLAGYFAKQAAGLVMKAAAFFITLGIAMVFVTIAVKLVELVANFPILSFANRLGGAGIGVVRAVLWIWIFFALVFVCQGTHWGSACAKQIQKDAVLGWIQEKNLVLMLLKSIL